MKTKNNQKENTRCNVSGSKSKGKKPNTQVWEQPRYDRNNHKSKK